MLFILFLSYKGKNNLFPVHTNTLSLEGVHIWNSFLGVYQIGNFYREKAKITPGGKWLFPLEISCYAPGCKQNHRFMRPRRWWSFILVAHHKKKKKSLWIKMFLQDQACSQGGGRGCNAPPGCTLLNLAKGPLLASKWAKNGFFLKGWGGRGSKSPLFRSKSLLFWGSAGGSAPDSIPATGLCRIEASIGSNICYRPIVRLYSCSRTCSLLWAMILQTHIFFFQSMGHSSVFYDAQGDSQCHWRLHDQARKVFLAFWIECLKYYDWMNLWQ